MRHFGLVCLFGLVPPTFLGTLRRVASRWNPFVISAHSLPPLLASGAHSIGCRMVVCCLCVDFRLPTSDFRVSSPVSRSRQLSRHMNFRFSQRSTSVPNSVDTVALLQYKTSKNAEQLVTPAGGSARYPRSRCFWRGGISVLSTAYEGPGVLSSQPYFI